MEEEYLLGTCILLQQIIQRGCDIPIFVYLEIILVHLVKHATFPQINETRVIYFETRTEVTADILWCMYLCHQRTENIISYQKMLCEVLQVNCKRQGSHCSNPDFFKFIAAWRCIIRMPLLRIVNWSFARHWEYRPLTAGAAIHLNCFAFYFSHEYGLSSLSRFTTIASFISTFIGA